MTQEHPVKRVQRGVGASYAPGQQNDLARLWYADQINNHRLLKEANISIGVISGEIVPSSHRADGPQERS